MPYDQDSKQDDRDAARWEEDTDTILGSQRLSIKRPNGERVIIPRSRAEVAVHS